MKIRAQVTMVLNLDKCIGCHTCSVTCKNVWTNRPGMEMSGSIMLKQNQALVTQSDGKIKKNGRGAGSLMAESSSSNADQDLGCWLVFSVMDICQPLMSITSPTRLTIKSYKKHLL